MYLREAEVGVVLISLIPFYDILAIASDAQVKRSRIIPRVAQKHEYACDYVLPRAITLFQALRLGFEAKPSL